MVLELIGPSNSTGPSVTSRQFSPYIANHTTLKKKCPIMISNQIRPAYLMHLVKLVHCKPYIGIGSQVLRNTQSEGNPSQRKSSYMVGLALFQHNDYFVGDLL
jgi:hypothetical protein